jgi:hypothetical protein
MFVTENVAFVGMRMTQIQDHMKHQVVYGAILEFWSENIILVNGLMYPLRLKITTIKCVCLFFLNALLFIF